ELGLRVGGDVSVLGVDDPPSAAYLSPGLSTVAQPLIDVGRAAVREIMTVIETGGQPTRHTLAPRLIVLRLGANHLRDYLRSLEQIGVNHVALNLRFNQADTETTLKRLAHDILPDFAG
ncbi:MAG: substrate-binding domain-containing protein, partial [Cyanobacteria bacterium P01_H01_bin.130]